MKRYPQGPPNMRGRPRKVKRSVRRHLSAVCQEVTWLSHFHEVFLEFTDIVNQSPVNSVNSEFWNFVKWAFFTELVQRIDRLSERQWSQRKKRVNSLMALLEDLKAEAPLINRDRYVGVSPNTEAAYKERHLSGSDPFDLYHFHRLNSEFSKIVGKKRFALTTSQVDRDIRGLRKRTKRITHYRNKQLAHIAANRGRMSPPTLGEITSAIQFIRKLTRKYFLLIEVGSHALDFGHVDITKIFMQPWIVGEIPRKALQDKFSSRQKIS